MIIVLTSYKFIPVFAFSSVSGCLYKFKNHTLITILLTNHQLSMIRTGFIWSPSLYDKDSNYLNIFSTYPATFVTCQILSGYLDFHLAMFLYNQNYKTYVAPIGWFYMLRNQEILSVLFKLCVHVRAC